MNSISITIQDENLKRYLKKLGGARKAMDVPIRTLGKSAQSELERRTPGQSIKSQWSTKYKYMIKGGVRVISEITIKNDPENEQVLIYLESGTDPHTINVSKAQWMKFYWPVVDKTVYAKTVNHPGINAYEIISGTYHFIDVETRKVIRAMEDKFNKTLNI